MADGGFGSIELTGRWIGFYRYRSEESGTFPLTAEIRQEGSRITGEMFDQVTERSELLDHYLELHREDLSPSDRARMEQNVAKIGTREIQVRMRLTDTADLDGAIAGDRVRFTKLYRGSVGTYWSVGGILVGSTERFRHRVEYDGQLDIEKRCIAGEWTIPRRGLLGRFLPPRGRGRFELYKKS